MFLCGSFTKNEENEHLQKMPCMPGCFHVMPPELLKRIIFNQFQELCARICWDNFILIFYVYYTGCPAESLTRPYYVH